jgi:hypothetical protein
VILIFRENATSVKLNTELAIVLLAYLHAHSLIKVIDVL